MNTEQCSSPAVTPVPRGRGDPQKGRMLGTLDCEMRRLLAVLGFTHLTSYPRMKEVVKMFRRMALKKHPDKPGGSTEDFQELQEAFLKTGTFLESFQQKSDPVSSEEVFDYEEDCAMKLFKEFYLNGKKFDSTFLHLFDNQDKEKEQYLFYNKCKETFQLREDGTLEKLARLELQNFSFRKHLPPSGLSRSVLTFLQI